MCRLKPAKTLTRSLPAPSSLRGVSSRHDSVCRRLQPGEYQMPRDDPIMTMEIGFNSADLSPSIRYFAIRPADRAERRFRVPHGVYPDVSWATLCCRCHSILAGHRRVFPPAFLNGAISVRRRNPRLRELVRGYRLGVA